MRRSHITLVSMTIVGILAVTGCSSDSKTSSGSTAGGAAPSTTVAPESIKVPDATVTAGLRQLPTTIAAAIAGIGTPDAKTKLDAIETLWASFEGTVRDKDAALYLSIEDQLTPLQRAIGKGDTATATTTAATISGLFTQYLTKYP